MTGVSYRNRRIRPKLVPAQSGGGTLTPGDSHAKRQEPNGTARRRDCGTAHDLVREGLLHHRQGSREFDVKDAVTDPDPASNPTDDREAAVLEDHEDDPVLEEITSLINSLSEDEQIDLVALLWRLCRQRLARGSRGGCPRPQRKHGELPSRHAAPRRLLGGGSFHARSFLRGVRNRAVLIEGEDWARFA